MTSETEEGQRLAEGRQASEQIEDAREWFGADVTPKC
jgi:hypothetical protein